MLGSGEDRSSRVRMRKAVDRIFNDDLMIALAAILAAMVILQIFIDFSNGMDVLFDYINYFIIAVFAAEYALKLYASESRSSFASDPLHILDLVIIVLALFDISKIGYISVLQNQAQLSPILRLVRVLPRVLPRVLLTFFLAGRTAKRMEHEKSIETKPDHPALQVSTFNAAGNISRLKSEDFGQLYASDEPLWADFQQIGEVDLDTIERATRIPPNLIENKLIRESFPRIDHVEGVPTIFLWDSQIKSENSKSDKFKSENLDSDHFKSENSSTETLNIVTNNLLIVCLDHKIVTLSRDKSRLFDKISCDLAERNSRQFINPNDEEFTVKILYHLLWQKLIDYGEIVQRIEQKTIGFEEIPVDKTSPQFLEETFHFKKEIQKIRSNLWHFHQVLHQLTDKKNSSILKIKNIEEFNNLHAESEYLLETAENIKESLISLIELHINTVSYDMNRVMKVIAVITCLAVIPSIIGGLLGVNLRDQPYDLTIGEVFFLVSSLMILGIYIFYKMDWLQQK